MTEINKLDAAFNRFEKAFGQFEVAMKSNSQETNSKKIGS